METFCVDLKEVEEAGKMEEFQQIVDDVHDTTMDYIQELAVELGLFLPQAANVWYLRTRSRWTPELEDRLIAELKAGKQINICEWPKE